jgi:hypothetical protein
LPAAPDGRKINQLIREQLTLSHSMESRVDLRKRIIEHHDKEIRNLLKHPAADRTQKLERRVAGLERLVILLVEIVCWIISIDFGCLVINAMQGGNYYLKIGEGIAVIILTFLLINFLFVKIARSYIE